MIPKSEGKVAEAPNPRTVEVVCKANWPAHMMVDQGGAALPPVFLRGSILERRSSHPPQVRVCTPRQGRRTTDDKRRVTCNEGTTLSENVQPQAGRWETRAPPQ